MTTVTGRTIAYAAVQVKYQRLNVLVAHTSICFYRPVLHSALSSHGLLRMANSTTKPFSTTSWIYLRPTTRTRGLLKPWGGGNSTC